MPSSTDHSDTDLNARDLVERAKRALAQSSSGNSQNEIGRLLAKHPGPALGVAAGAGLLLGSSAVRKVVFKLGWTGVKLYAARKLAEVTADAVSDKPSNAPRTTTPTRRPGKG